jgi:Domain of unknown function (DUF4129)
VETSSRLGKAVLTSLGVVGAVVVVALAARGSTPAGDNRTRKPSDALIDVLFSLYVVGLVAGGCLFLYMLVLHRHLRASGHDARRHGFREMTLVGIVLLTLGLLAAKRLAGYDGPLRRPREDLFRNATSPPPDPLTDPGRRAEFAWGPMLITIGLIVLGVAAWWFAGRARKKARGELRVGLALAVAQALDESLDDLRAEADPRKAVIATYARLERVLAYYGVARRPSEAPLEYLARVLASLDVGEQAVATLTHLFERAKFSQHAVAPEMKEQAIAALQQVRDDLLVAQARAEQARAEAMRARADAQALQ